MLLGVDVGGTFTDAALLDGERLHTAKVPRPPEDQSRGVIAAIEEVLRRAGAQGRRRRGVHPRDDGRHQRAARGARRPDRAGRHPGVRGPARDRAPEPPQPLPPLPRAKPRRSSTPSCASRRPSGSARRGRRGAHRGGAAGLSTGCEDAGGAESVAVCLLFAFRDPAHEARIARALREALPDVHVSASHEVLAGLPRV